MLFVTHVDFSCFELGSQKLRITVVPLRVVLRTFCFWIQSCIVSFLLIRFAQFQCRSYSCKRRAGKLLMRGLGCDTGINLACKLRARW